MHFLKCLFHFLLCQTMKTRDIVAFASNVCQLNAFQAGSVGMRYCLVCKKCCHSHSVLLCFTAQVYMQERSMDSRWKKIKTCTPQWHFQEVVWFIVDKLLETFKISWCSYDSNFKWFKNHTAQSARQPRNCNWPNCNRANSSPTRRGCVSLRVPCRPGPWSLRLVRLP